MIRGLRDDYRRSLKSMDTEEGIDLVFYRPVGYLWARLAAYLGISPNTITIMAIFLGIAAGVLFYFPELWINVIGMSLLVWANSFDSADGQLARLTGSYSRLGRILDGLCGDIWFVAIYISIILRENTFSPFFSSHVWVLWVMAVVTGICHAQQAEMADYYRQFHLYFIKGADGSELDNTDSLKRQIDAERSGGRIGLWRRISMAVYLGYTRRQEAVSPAMQSLRRELQRRFPDNGIPKAFRDDFRRSSLPLMKYTNILSFNWRTIVLFTVIFFGQPWLYFLVELTVFNVLLVYMIYRHERMCRKLVNSLDDGQY